MTNPSHRSLFLILDPNPEVWEEAMKGFRDSTLEVRCITEEKKALEVLTNAAEGIACVILNPGISAPIGLPVIRHVYEARPTVPIYLAPPKDFSVPEKMLTRLGVRKILNREKLAEEAKEILKSFQFSSEDAIKSGQALSKEKVGEETARLSDEQFHAIRAQDFLSGSKSIFDIYVRLSSGRYVKILQSGDAFTRDRILTYLNKGVTHFYILKELQKSYLAYCDEMVKRLISSDAITTTIKIRQVANLGHETAEFLKNTGVTSENLDLARNYAITVDRLVEKLGVDKSNHILGFMKDMLTYEHSVGVVMVASLILDSLGFERKKSAETVGLACLLHDIGLQGAPDEVKNEDEKLMNDDQKKIFLSHPIVGAEMLQNIKGIDPSVVGSVLQHHERRSGNGFPHQKKTGQIQRVAEVIGIADEFLLLMRQFGKDPQLNFSEELEQRIFNGFSLPVVEAFRSTVVPKYQYTRKR